MSESRNCLIACAYLVVLGGLVSFASWTLALSLAYPGGLLDLWISDSHWAAFLSTSLPGAAATALVAPFFIRGMLAGVKNSSNQAKKATAFGMGIGWLSCPLLPLAVLLIAAWSEGAPPQWAGKTHLAIASLSFFAAVPAMLVGAIVARAVEGIARGLLALRTEFSRNSLREASRNNRA